LLSAEVCIVRGWIAIIGVLVWSELKALYEEDGRESLHTPL
jgi:hypothetical protein